MFNGSPVLGTIVFGFFSSTQKYFDEVNNIVCHVKVLSKYICFRKTMNQREIHVHGLRGASNTSKKKKTKKKIQKY